MKFFCCMCLRRRCEFLAGWQCVIQFIRTYNILPNCHVICYMSMSRKQSHVAINKNYLHILELELNGRQPKASNVQYYIEMRLLRFINWPQNVGLFSNMEWVDNIVFTLKWMVLLFAINHAIWQCQTNLNINNQIIIANQYNTYLVIFSKILCFIFGLQWDIMYGVLSCA